MPPQPWTSMPIIHHGGGGTATSMVCGYLYCDDLPFNPVLATLPPFMKIRPTSEPLARWVDASIQYALASGGPGTDHDPLLQRLPELLFTECLCEFARQRSEEPGWLAALADPIVGRALACLHREPAFAWTLENLARRAASSRSVLDERFRALLGRAPMSYLTAWRLQLASQQLRTTRAGLAEIAQATGYASEASLSRAFKREVGMSPGQWRQAALEGDA
jgi:AraC-like DNA-binding protein